MKKKENGRRKYQAKLVLSRAEVQGRGAPLSLLPHPTHDNKEQEIVGFVKGGLYHHDPHQSSANCSTGPYHCKISLGK